MLDWIRSLGRPGRGDAVVVIGGPYAGQTGVIQLVTDEGRLGVYIDECCQPVLDADQVRRARRRDIGNAARDAKLNDPEAVMRRHEIESRKIGRTGF
jgi:ribosomal protein L24